MNTVIITTSEYNRLLALRANKKVEVSKGKFMASAFGIFKNSFGKTSSTVAVNKMRKAWRT